MRHFEDLDLLSKFIVNPAPPKKAGGSVGIQELDLEVVPEGETKYDWFSVPRPANYDEDEDDVSLTMHSYGFGLSKRGILTDKVSCSLPPLRFRQTFSLIST